MPRSQFALGSLFLLCLLSAVPACGADFWMTPVAPVAGDSVTFYYRTGCGSLDTIERQNFTLNLRFNVGPCSPPRTEPTAVPIDGGLEAGEWTANIQIRVAGGQPITEQTLRFVVRRDPEDQTVSMRVRPSAIFTTGDVQLLLEQVGDEPLCENLQQCEVSIGDAKVTFRAAPRGLSITAPAHARGLVNVTVTQPGPMGGLTKTAQVYYHDPNDFAPSSVYERILFPILGNMPGAGGSLWKTETAILNEQLWFVETANNIRPIVCVTFPCGERIGPRSYVTFEGGEYPRGVALLTPRNEAPYLAFTSRVRDVSESEDNFGSTQPVVREQQMVRGGAATILDVPLDPRYRVRLRLYAFDETEEQRLDVRLITDERTTRSERFVDLRRTCTGAACAAIPYYAEVVIPASSADARANFYIDRLDMPDVLLWGFASVTNNKTQHVTVIGANGNSDLR